MWTVELVVGEVHDGAVESLARELDDAVAAIAHHVHLDRY
jgi:hypothetical protein